jgi:hypothetical protein
MVSTLLQALIGADFSIANITGGYFIVLTFLRALLEMF